MINTQALVIDKAKTYVIRAHVYMCEYRIYMCMGTYMEEFDDTAEYRAFSCVTCSSLK